MFPQTRAAHSLAFYADRHGWMLVAHEQLPAMHDSLAFTEHARWRVPGCGYLEVLVAADMGGGESVTVHVFTDVQDNVTAEDVFTVGDIGHMVWPADATADQTSAVDGWLAETVGEMQLLRDARPIDD